MPKPVFEGLKVVGFVFAGVGPFVMRVLANHGATAVAIESMSRPDMTRSLPPFKDGIPGVNRSGMFAWANSNRYSLALNLKHPRSPEVTRRLISWADVVVENFTPGVMASWGLSYEDVKKINPGIIMISLSMQGQTGPRRLVGGYGAMLQSLAGYPLLVGYPGEFPCLIDRSYPDFIAPRYGVIATIAALDHRRRTGKGQYIDCSEYEGALQYEIPVLLDYSANRKIQTRDGNKYPGAAPHGVYPCQGDDRWCAIAVFTDDEWAAFCGVIGNPKWTKDPKFRTLLGRKKHEDELNRLVGEWTIKRDAGEIMTAMQQAGVGAGVVQTPEDVLENDPQLKHRRYFQTLHHGEMGDILYARPSYILSETPSQLRTASPLLGEHTDYVCKELLGMPEDEYASLLLDNVFQ